MISVLIQEGEDRVRGELAYDNPDVAMVISILYHRKMNARSISCPEEIYEGVYHIRRKLKRGISFLYHCYRSNHGINIYTTRNLD